MRSLDLRRFVDKRYPLRRDALIHRRMKPAITKSLWNKAIVRV